MRYAIVSDLHGNRQAWNAVLADVLVEGADEIICLGDVVGYGPAPAEVLERAHERVHHFVMGNHDAVLAGVLDPAAFNEHAVKRLEWTAGQLDSKAGAFLSTLPLTIEGMNFRCVHGTPDDPAAFDYLFDAENATASWAAHPESLFFVGHTHAPALFVTGQSGRAYELEPQDFSLESGKRYIVNPGSVGQPRDGDVRAAYCLLDLDAQSVFFRKVAFDIEGYRGDLNRHRLDRGTSYFLDAAEARAIPPVRELLDFRPEDAEVSSALRELPAARIEEVHRSARRWRRVAVGAFLLFLTVCIAAAWGWSRLNADSFTWIEPAMPLSEIRADTVRAELLVAPDSSIGRVTADTPLPHWALALRDSDKQHLSVHLPAAQSDEDEPPYFVLQSAELLPVEMRSAPVAAAAGSRFTAKAQFRNKGFRDGFVQVEVRELLADGTEKLLMKTEPRRFSERPDRWLPTSITLAEPLPEPARLQYVLRGRFQGTVEIRKCSFFRRE